MTSHTNRFPEAASPAQAAAVRMAALPAAILGIVVAVAVAFSGVCPGVHYPTDVTASFLTAATGAALLTGLWNRSGLALPARIPFLAKLGPVPAPQA